MLRLGHFERGYLIEEARKNKIARRVERERKEAIRAEAERVRRAEIAGRTLLETLDDLLKTFLLLILQASIFAYAVLLFVGQLLPCSANTIGSFPPCRRHYKKKAVGALGNQRIHGYSSPTALRTGRVDGA